MTTDQAFDKMLQIAPLLGEILNDTDASELSKAIRADKGTTPAGSVMQQLLPLFAGKHREALYSIVAIATDATVEQIRAQPIINTLNSLRAALVDETMMFFLTCLHMVRKF